MDKQSKQDDRRLDEELAEFTDRVLDSEKPEEVSLAEGDPVLRELENVVLHLQQAWKMLKPDASLVERLNTRIKKEWREQKWSATQKEQRDKPGWRSAWKIQRLVTARLTVALLAVLALGLVLLPFFGTQLPASAEGPISVVLISLLVFCVVVLLLLFLTGRKS